MPLIDPGFQKKVAFCYPSRDVAEQHGRLGGSAFVLLKRAEPDSKKHFVPYLVSNRHVVWTGGSPVVRFNKRDGSSHILDYTPDQWICHPDGDDIAIACAWGDLDPDIVDVTAVHLEEHVLTQEVMAKNEIGVGDEVFMVGRFINHQGRQRVSPAVRFGSISLMPENLTHNDYGVTRQQLSFAVEMRSRTGFSGSPVFVYRTLSTDIFHDLDWQMANNFSYGLLGVNWGYVKDDEGDNTWLNGVVPAWKIFDILDSSKLREAHEMARRQIVQ